MKRYSEILQTEIEDTKDGVRCADGAFYTFDELKSIKECEIEQKRYLHKIKKMFNGVVV